MSKDNPSLSDTEREALVWKLARDAESQFWQRLSKPISRGFGIVAATLAILGLSAYAIVPGWIDTQAKDAIKAALEKESVAYSEQAKLIREQTLQQLADTRISAAESRKLAESLVETQRKNLEELINQTRDEVDAVQKQTAALKKKADSVESLAKIEDVDQLAAKIREIADLADNIGESNLAALSARIDEAVRGFVELDARLNGLEYSQQLGFPSGLELRNRLSSRLLRDESIQHSLLIFATEQQRTWIVTTDSRFFVVLIDRHEQESLLLGTPRPTSDVSRVEAVIKDERNAVLDLGLGTRVYYSQDLVPDRGDLVESVKQVLRL